MNCKYLLLCALLLTSGLNACRDKDKPAGDSAVEEKPVLDESIPAVIPHIYIQISGNQEVEIKEQYLNATVSIAGHGYPDLDTVSTRIRGRGNSTWLFPKKPYRLKLDSKAEVLGLHAAKDWVLLANYQDYTFMTNAVAMKAGQLIGLPYTHTIIPVDLTVNGVYRGNYNLTQQIEVREGRVDVGDDGLLLELDDNFDEDYQFHTPQIKLPVMIKSPDITSEEQFLAIRSDFEAFEKLVFAADFPNNNFGDYIDKLQLVNYLILHNLTGNIELIHPKSVYIHKKPGGKYTMGPVWDFDWGFGFDEIKERYFIIPEIKMLNPGDERPGTRFFARLMQDPEIKKLYREQWEIFKNNHFTPLLAYVEEFAAKIRESQKKDYEIWRQGPNNFPQTKADLKTYLRTRARHVDRYVQSL